MSYTYEQLSKMTVVELRKIADGVEHEATKGHLTMHKDKLLPALCVALGVETHAHHEVKGIDKGQTKLRIRSLKKEREAALQTHDPAKLKDIRMQIKQLKKTLRKAIV